MGWSEGGWNFSIRQNDLISALIGTADRHMFLSTYITVLSNDQTLDAEEGRNIQVAYEIDIDTSNITSKGIHVDSNISIYSEYVDDNVEKTKTEFCIRTDYGKDGIIESSVNLYKDKNTINFVFEVWAFTSCDVTIDEEQAGEAQQVSLDYSTDADSNIESYEIDTSNAKT